MFDQSHPNVSTGGIAVERRYDIDPASYFTSNSNSPKTSINYGIAGYNPVSASANVQDNYNKLY